MADKEKIRIKKKDRWIDKKKKSDDRQTLSHTIFQIDRKTESKQKEKITKRKELDRKKEQTDRPRDKENLGRCK